MADKQRHHIVDGKEVKEGGTIKVIEYENDTWLKKGKSDLVNHPPHYTFGKFEVIEVLEDWFPLDPLLWQIVKYIARAKHKGDYLQDLKKAQFYLNREVESWEKKVLAAGIAKEAL